MIAKIFEKEVKNLLKDVERQLGKKSFQTFYH